MHVHGRKTRLLLQRDAHGTVKHRNYAVVAMKVPLLLLLFIVD